jgi:hypothetical protein
MKESFSLNGVGAFRATREAPQSTGQTHSQPLSVPNSKSDRFEE